MWIWLFQGGTTIQQSQVVSRVTAGALLASGNDASGPKPCLNPESWSDESFAESNAGVQTSVWRQHPTKPKLYGHLSPIMKTIKVKRTRHAGHCWRSRDELISDVLLWIPSHGRAKAGRPTRTYIQQLCEDTGCSPEDLPEAMNDREDGERGSGISVLDDDDIYIYIYIYI